MKGRSPTSRPPTSRANVRVRLAGTGFLLYFYPRDNTPDAPGPVGSATSGVIKGKKTKVFGVSRDSIKSHLRFGEGFELPPLLCGRGPLPAKTWRLGLKKFMGREFEGIHHVLLVDESGKIRKAYHKVKAKDHPWRSGRPHPLENQASRPASRYPRGAGSERCAADQPAIPSGWASR